MESYIYYILTIGLLYSILALVVVFAFRLLGFPDLTPDGSFVLGGAISSVILIHDGWLPISYISAFFFGGFAGLLTALFHNVFKISKLLSGILVMMMLYSVSLRVMSSSNISLINQKTIWMSEYHEASLWLNLVIAFFVLIFIFIALLLLLKTNLGLLLRALGDSEKTMNNLQINTSRLNYVGLFVANAIAGFAGAVISQYQGFVDISMGTGIVIVSLAAVIIGEIVLRPQNVFYLLLSAVLGMIVYQFIISVALRAGLPSTDMKMATVVLTLLFLSVERFMYRHKWMDRQIGNRSI